MKKLQFVIATCVLVSTSASASDYEAAQSNQAAMLNEMRNQTIIMEQAEARRQFEWAERDMLDRRERYDAMRREQERNNERYFGRDYDNRHPKNRY